MKKAYVNMFVGEERAHPIARIDLRAILFYAKVGIQHSQPGSYPDADKIVNRISKEFHIGTGAAEWGRFLKQGIRSIALSLEK